MTLQPIPNQTPMVTDNNIITTYWIQYWQKVVLAINVLLGNVGEQQATGSYPLLVTPVLFAELPATPAVGTITAISDSNVNTWGAIIAGGGANVVLAWFNGSFWVVIGK